MASSPSNLTLRAPSPQPYLREFNLTMDIVDPFWPAILLFGLVANVTNIVVFLRGGVKDSVTVLLISLSTSDFVFLTLISPTVCQFLIRHYAPNHKWPFNMRNVYVTYWPAFTMYDFSAFISVTLGVTRCACVAMPLRFKSVFTKARTVKIVIAVFVLAVSLRGPVLSIYRLTWRTDPRTNASYVALTTKNSQAMSRINDVLNRNSMLYINFIIMISCVCLLSFKLYQASRVRRSYTATSKSSSSRAAEKADTSGLSSKDLHVIQSVVLVCGIFIVSQLPFLIYSTARLVDSEFNVQSSKSLRNLVYVWTRVSLTCSYLNASVNIIVYYNFNSKYRAQFLSVFQKRTASPLEKN